MSQNTDNEVQLTQHIRDNTLVQLKEMLHYGQGNSEKLSAQWLSFDEGGAYQNTFFADKLADVLNKQATYIEELNQTISDIEMEANRIDNEA